MRRPAAIARCACPIHIPSIRSGMTSIASRRLKVKNAPSESEPEITIRPAAKSTRAWAMSGRKVEKRDVQRSLPVGVDRPLEDGIRCGIEVRGPPLLLRERLDDVNARDRLLRDDRHLGEGLLDVAKDGLGRGCSDRRSAR